MAMAPTVGGEGPSSRPRSVLGVRGRAVQTDIASEGNRSAFGWAAFWIGLVGVLAAFDLWDDIHDGKPAWILSLHVVFSSGALATTCVFGVLLVRLRRRVLDLTERLQLPGPDEERWRTYSAEVLPALAGAIHRQFSSWGLSPEERQISLLLLNGLAPDQIAELRGDDPRLVEQRIAEVYRKAGLSGRAELNAFFLSDLVRT